MDFLSPPYANTRLLCEILGQQLVARHWHVATAESCTGGALAASITQIAGSSAWFECGVVSYANHIKQKLLQVNTETLATYGAVSEAVVIQMAKGVLELSDADIAIAISGVAGPSGGSTGKPVGTVWFAWAVRNGEVRTQVLYFSGDRLHIQHQAVEQGLQGLLTFFD